MNRDDIIISPTIAAAQPAASPTRARQERTAARARGRSGVLGRLAQARAARAAFQAGATTRAGARAVGFARGGAAAARGGAGAAASTIGAVVTGLLVAGVVALRLGSGVPLEGLGAELNRTLLGDVDDEARAKMAVRESITGDRDLLRIAGQEGRTNAQVGSIAADLQKLQTQREIGASILREQFPTNTVLDALIVRAAKAFGASWEANAGPAKLDELQAVYSEVANRAPRSKGSAR